MQVILNFENPGTNNNLNCLMFYEFSKKGKMPYMEKNIEYHKKSPNIKQILTVIGARDIQAS